MLISEEGMNINLLQIVLKINNTRTKRQIYKKSRNESTCDELQYAFRKW